MSNASWTKTTMTAAKDQTGIDGAANSASSLTATAGAASCVQTITQAATSATLSFFIKRITGTGTITLQQGASTLDVTASVNAATYTRVSLNASVLNPSIGVVLGTNGDKIAVDMGQFENLAFATSPVPTTTASVARNADVLTYPITGNGSASAGTVYAEISTIWTGAAPGAAAVVVGFDGAGQPLALSTSTNSYIYDGTASVIKTPLAESSTGIRKHASSWSGVVMGSTGDGLTQTTGAFDGTMGASASIGIGVVAGGANQLCGAIKNVRIWTRALADSQLVGLTS